MRTKHKIFSSQKLPRETFKIIQKKNRKRTKKGLAGDFWRHLRLPEVPKLPSLKACYASKSGNQQAQVQ